MNPKTCPWCAEEIPSQAVKCRYCGSRVAGGVRDPREWHRGYPERRLAGVCAALAYSLGVPVTAVRAVVLLLVLFHGFGIALYAILWFLLPREPGALSGLDRTLQAARSLLGQPQGEDRPPASPAGRDAEKREPEGGGTTGGWNPTRR